MPSDKGSFMHIEKRKTIAQVVQELQPDVRLLRAMVEITESCNQEHPSKTAKWNYSEASICSQQGRMFQQNTPSATSHFQGEGPIFSALNEAIHGLKMEKGRHEKKGVLPMYQTDDGKSVTRTYKAMVEFEIIKAPDTAKASECAP
jgi:hypothetical protein